MGHTQPYWQPHPIADLFPRMTPEEMAALEADMLARHEQGLPPLEHPVLLYEGRILDGRHRHDAWANLAARNAGGGFFADNPPPSQEFTPAQHGTLSAWMRAKSRNMVHRHIPADQKAAIFLTAVEMYPELKEAIEEIKADNSVRRKEGKPLVAGDQRGNTNKQIADMAGVGATTVKQVKRLKDRAPDEFDKVLQGKTTVKKALGSGTKRKGPATAGGKPTTPSDCPVAGGQGGSTGDGPAVSSAVRVGAGEPAWDVALKVSGYAPVQPGTSPDAVAGDLRAGTLVLAVSCRLERADGTLVAELTDLSLGGYAVTPR